MHPHLLALVAAEHVKDMRAKASEAQRVRDARRDQPAAAARPARRARAVQPCQ